jgi:DNA-binding IscR family transcriptional regulator
MFQLQAFDSDSRKTTEEIAVGAFGFDADANSLKPVMSDLRIRGLVKTQRGSGGGCWLSDKGRSRAKRLQDRLG